MDDTVDTVIVDIVEDGDIILECADGRRLRVSSAVLHYASSVFAAMFGKSFAEGQGERSPHNPKNIRLQDDDSGAILMLCRMLHFKAAFETPDEELESNELSRRMLQLSIVADKYDCIDSLRLKSEALLGRCATRTTQNMPSFVCMADLTTSAYLCRSEVHFALFTRRMIMRYTEVFSTLSQHDILAYLPPLALGKVVLVLAKLGRFLTHAVNAMELRYEVTSAISESLAKMAERTCAYNDCSGSVTSDTFTSRLARGLKLNPPIK